LARTSSVGKIVKGMVRGLGSPLNSDKSNNETVNVLAKLMKRCGSW